MASPVADVYFSSGNQVAAGRYVEPDWAPVAGEIKSISHNAGYFGTNGGAVLSEINPLYQAWNPLGPGSQPYSGYSWGDITAFSSFFYNEDTREFVGYGAGHAAYNINAPFSFSLNTLRWSFLDVPIPADGFTAYVAAVNGGATPSTELFRSFYPPEMFDATWGDWNGDWDGWGALYGEGPWIKPGQVQVTPGHSRASLINIPASLIGNTKGALMLAHNPTGITSGPYGTSSHLFDYSSGRQRRMLNRYTLGTSGPITHDKGIVVDKVTGKVIIFGSTGPTYTKWTLWDVATETWSERTASANAKTTSDHGGNTLHEPSRLIIVPCRMLGAVPASAGTTFDFYAVSADDLVGGGIFSPSLLTVNVIDDWPINQYGDNRYIYWAYCPDDEALYAVTGSNNSANYWRLAPPENAVTTGQYLAGTWSITKHTFANDGRLVSAASTGFTSPYSRLAWDKKSRSFIWVSSGLSNPVRAFRPWGL